MVRMVGVGWGGVGWGRRRVRKLGLLGGGPARVSLMKSPLPSGI